MEVYQSGAHKEQGAVKSICSADSWNCPNTIFWLISFKLVKFEDVILHYTLFASFLEDVRCPIWKSVLSEILRMQTIAFYYYRWTEY